MKNKLSPPYISSLDLRTLNDAIIGIYRHLNRIANSADEITFKNTEDGTKEIIIKDGNKKYVSVSQKLRFGQDLKSVKDAQIKKVKKELTLNNVTNESKATMFDDAEFTGDTTVAGLNNNLTINGTSGAGTIRILGGATNHDAELILEADKSADTADSFKIYVRDAATNGDGLRFAKQHSNGTFVDMMKMTYGADAATSSQIDFYGKVSSNNIQFRDIKVHQWHSNDTNADYITFGGSQAEGDAVTDASNIETLFIAPYAGKLDSIKLQCTGAAGDTVMFLRVNGTDKSTVGVTGISSESTVTFDFTTLADAQREFSAGDRLRINFAPSSAPNYVTATSVWVYDV